MTSLDERGCGNTENLPFTYPVLENCPLNQLAITVTIPGEEAARNSLTRGPFFLPNYGRIANQA